jgi:transcriptional regulator with XRE-family HTH domain
MTVSPEHDPTDVAIGERVHQLMWRRRISQTQMAETLGVAQPTLSRKLRGERPWFAAEIAAAARSLDVSIGSLFGDGPGPEGGSRAGVNSACSSRRLALAVAA